MKKPILLFLYLFIATTNFLISGMKSNALETQEEQPDFQTFIDILHGDTKPHDLEENQLYDQIKLSHKLNCTSVLKSCCQLLIDRLPDKYEPIAVHDLLYKTHQKLSDNIDNELASELRLKYYASLANIHKVATTQFRIYQRLDYSNMVQINGHELITIDDDTTLIKINLLNGNIQRNLIEKEDWMYYFLKDHGTKISFLANLSATDETHLFGASTMDMLKFHQSGGSNKFFQIDKDTLATTKSKKYGENQEIKLWNKTTTECIKTLLLDNLGFIEHVEKVDHNHLMILADSTLLHLNTDTLEYKKIIEDDIAGITQINDNLLACKKINSEIMLFNKTTMQVEGTLNGHSKGVINVFPLNEKILCSNAYDGTFRLWDIETQRCLFISDDNPAIRTAIKGNENQWISFQRDDFEDNEIATVWNSDNPYNLTLDQIIERLDSKQ